MNATANYKLCNIKGQNAWYNATYMMHNLNNTKKPSSVNCYMFMKNLKIKKSELIIFGETCTL